MIEKRTVLILGAGASVDYGYPLGAGLKKSILDMSHLPKHLEDTIRTSSILGSHVNVDNQEKRLTFLHKNCGFSIDHIKQFHTHFGFTPKASIDAFLENRREFIDIGKILIAMSIFSYEDYSLLTNNPPLQHWYGHLFNMMTQNWQKFLEYKLSIISYNYDRSFETFFINALASTFGKPLDECMKAANQSISMIHIQGRIADFPNGQLVKPYDSKSVLGAFINKAANELKIIHEGAEVVDNYCRAHQALSIAERVFILGFGFDDTNLERLKLSDYSAPIYATRKGISDLNVERINDLTNSSILFSPNREIGIVDFLDSEASLSGYVSPNMPKNTKLKAFSV